jgi:ribonuclease HI
MGNSSDRSRRNGRGGDLYSDVQPSDTEYTLIFDGGYDKHGGYGSYVIFQGCRPLIFKSRRKFETRHVSTGNQAEYWTLVCALAELQNVAAEGSVVTIYGDSKLVICQIRGEWKARNSIMKSYRDRCLGVLDDYDWEANWWCRDQSVKFFNH